MGVANKYQNELGDLKLMVRESREYATENVKRFHQTRKFLFKQNLTEQQKEALGELQRPQLEFNTTEAYISRLRGEFSKQEPSFIVHQSPDASNVPVQTIKMVEGHLAAILYNTNRDLSAYQTYTDQLSGGFSVIKVVTEYENEMSFNQDIKIVRPYDVTLCGFDPLATMTHKGDGEYCFELFPMTQEDFKRRYPGVTLSGVSFTGNSDYGWSYRSQTKKVLLNVHFYKKKKKKLKLLHLADNTTVTVEEYEQMKTDYEQKTIALPPAVKNERTTSITTVCRYDFIEDQVLDYKETIFPMLPLIYVDGNSFYLSDNENDSPSTQYARPYIYNALGAQRLKNLSGQSLGNELENMVQHKYIVAKEAIPPEYKDAYTNTQKANTLVYNAFMADGSTPLPPPQAVDRPPIPPEIIQTFQMCDPLMQTILGSYDASLGINNNQLSGVAIVEGATQSNAAAMPYVVNYLASLNQAAQLILKLMPQVYSNPRMIPVFNKQSKISYQGINGYGENSMPLNYPQHALNVTVEAGVNFEIQQGRAIQVLGMLGQVFPAVNQLINEKGLSIIFDNINIRGAEELKSLADDFMKEMQQMKQSQGQQPNPQVLNAQAKQQATQARMQIDTQKIQNDQMQMMLDYKKSQAANVVEMHKLATERAVDGADLHLRTHDQLHNHRMDAVSHATDLLSAMKEDKQNKSETAKE